MLDMTAHSITQPRDHFAKNRLILLVFLTVGIPTGLMNPTATLGQDWTAFRGSDGLAVTSPSSILAQGQPVTLKVRWRKQLGNGYSSPVVTGKHLVLVYSDGQSNQVVCLDRNNGDQIWQQKLGPYFKGENGSFDGPISTPLIFDGHVYVLDPNGRFVCYALTNGKEVWSKHLVDDFGSKKPTYGFATSPIIAGDTIVLQTGVVDGSLAGIEPKTGNIKWSATNDTINSQTPVLIDFHGTPVILASGGTNLAGIDASNGQVLFNHPHQGGNGSAVTPVPLDGQRVLLTLDDAYAKVFSLRPGDTNKIEVSDEWQNRSIKNTYNVPVLSNGNLFAYSTRILTCVDPSTGNAKWKSRAPGDGFLISVDGHIIINTKKGSLHIAKASGDAYQELASLTNLFDDLCWSLPAYTDNSIYCRNLKEVVCVDIVSTESGTADAELGQGGQSTEETPYTTMLSHVNAAVDKMAGQKVINDYLDSQTSMPVIEGSVVRFMYHGPAENVAVASDIFGARQEREMQRVPGTDLFVFNVELEADQRANYLFLVDFKPQTDPRNTRTFTSTMYAGEMEFAARLRDEKPLEMSWFGMPEWKEPEYLQAEREALNGKIVAHTLAAETSDADATVLEYDVYLPPGYDRDDSQRYRSIYVFAVPGPNTQEMVSSVDWIFANQSELPHAILVLMRFPPTAAATAAITEKLIPAVDGQYRTVADRNSRTTVGFGFTAASAVGLANANDELFSGGAMYSPLLLDAERATFLQALDQLKNPMTYYVDWGRYDMFNPHENWDIRSICKEVFEACEKSSQATVSGGMFNDTTDWSSWRNRYEGFLKLGLQN